MLDAWNRAILMRVGAVIAFALILSLTVPPPARPPFLAGLFMMPTLIATGVAVARRHGLDPTRFTHWDEAAVFLLLSLLFEALTGEAAREALREAAGVPGAG